ncbi:uncharacterized protein LOC109855665 [Pseudomyrmex gracilis]|uniref:uncharacterized protein LOC109855665 n=1 Tax=Pseudomyrmex gracilis TaxID=219809 RepID=UPI000995D5CF|nr:uncharacterized protein LOC109855665 [Pseudomyrmex gracilis]
MILCGRSPGTQNAEPTAGPSPFVPGASTDRQQRSSFYREEGVGTLGGVDRRAPQNVMRGLIFLFATAVTCRAAYVGSSAYGNPVIHSQPQPSHAPPAPVGEDGNVIDTPEVAQAKAAHFAEFARAAARAAQNEKQHSSVYNPQISSPAYSYQAVQPTAVPFLRQANYQQPTPIYQTPNHVQAPVYTPVHYQQPQQQFDARANFVGQKSYTLPAKPTAFVPAPLAEDGTVVDTPEVAALKAARLAELAEAEARAYKHANAHPEEDQGQVYSGSPAGPAPTSLGHYGSSRAFPGTSYPGTQPYAAQQAFNPAFGYQPQQYQSQHLIRIVLTATSLLIGTTEQSISLYEHHGPWAPISSDGTVVDTPEVVQARAAHLAARAAAIARLTKARIELSPVTDATAEVPSETTSQTITSAPATEQTADDDQRSMAPLGQDGLVVDTSEVAAAKAKHLAIRARIEAESAVPEFNAYGHEENLLYLPPIRVVSPIVYRGPSAPLGPDGQVVDTPEVAVARAAHLKAHARAVALTTGYDIYC